MPADTFAIHSNQSARRTTYAGVPLREDTAYANAKGEQDDGIRKRSEKIIDKLQEPLRKSLEPDEVVLSVAGAQLAPGAIEQAVFGWHSLLIGAGALVLTNHRLLHFLLGKDGTWKRSLRSARWGDLQEVKARGGWLAPTLQFRYRNGTKETYRNIRRDDSRRMKVIMDAVLPASSSETSAAQGMVSLCPECRAPLTAGVYECPQCHLKFKDEKTMFRRALLIPGGGYFYTGHAFLGLWEIMVSGFLFLVAMVSVGEAFGLLEPQEATTRDTALMTAGIFTAILVLEKWFIVRHCRGFIQKFIPQG